MLTERLIRVKPETNDDHFRPFLLLLRNAAAAAAAARRGAATPTTTTTTVLLLLRRLLLLLYKTIYNLKSERIFISMCMKLAGIQMTVPIEACNTRFLTRIMTSCNLWMQKT